MRPVRLAPCAAGANPTINSRGRSDPQPGTGRPQYGWSAKARRLTTATSSRHLTSRGQARHTLITASSSGIEPAWAANSETSAASAATGVCGLAGSPGQPLPGTTGEPNAWRVFGWTSTSTSCIDAVPVTKFGRRSYRFGINSGATSHEKQQPGPSILDPVRHADGDRGDRYFHNRLPVAGVAAPRPRK